MESKEEEEKKQRDRTLKQNQKCKEEQEEEGYPPRKALWYCWSQEKVQHTLSNMYKDFGLIFSWGWWEELYDDVRCVQMCHSDHKTPASTSAPQQLLCNYYY